MAVPNYLKQYDGRRTDLLLIAVQNDLAGDASPASTSIYGANRESYRIAGIRKLAQRFTILLFTPLGGDPVFADSGCHFLAASKSGTWRNAGDVRRDFNSALLHVLPQMRNLQAASDPLDEQIQDVSLASVVITPTVLALSVTLSAKSQGTNELLIPIETRNSA